MKGVYTRIEMATMAGYNRSVLVNTSIASPVALTVDIEDEKIFWLDSKLKLIASVRSDGGPVTIEHGLKDIYGIGLVTLAYNRDNNVFYLTDIDSWFKNTLYAVYMDSSGATKYQKLYSERGFAYLAYGQSISSIIFYKNQTIESECSLVFYKNRTFESELIPFFLLKDKTDSVFNF